MNVGQVEVVAKCEGKVENRERGKAGFGVKRAM